jgi:hypothetical protein
MKLFNLFGKKSVAANEPAPITQPGGKENSIEGMADYIRSQPEGIGDRNFVDDLVDYFRSKPAVTAAYFGFAYNNIDKQYHLFLAIDHDIEAESVTQMTWFLKSLHMKDTQIEYASPTQSSDMLEYISQHNPPFYHRDMPALLHQKIMKQWFNVEKYKQELIDTLKQSMIFTLTNDPAKTKQPFGFANCTGPQGEYIPLFSTRDMVSKSGMTDLPADILVTQMSFESILKMFDRELFFVLNPGTPFEVELRA